MISSMIGVYHGYKSNLISMVLNNNVECSLLYQNEQNHHSVQIVLPNTFLLYLEYRTFTFINTPQSANTLGCLAR